MKFLRRPSGSGENGLGDPSWLSVWWSGQPIAAVLAIRDFRLLWFGAFLSFTGGWVQIVAQGYFVFELTRDEAKLALVAFLNSLPTFLFGFVAGTLTDSVNKRTLLVVCQALLACAALYLAGATYFGWVTYWQIAAVAFFTGLVGCVEMPTRQSIIGAIVPHENIKAAIPLQAMTFNVSRIIGPAIGGLLLPVAGVAGCYLLNGISYLGLFGAATQVKADLNPTRDRGGPLLDLILEGARFTFRDNRLRTLFIMEIFTSVFGVCYVALIPAYADKLVARIGTGAPPVPNAISTFFAMIGVGAFGGLLLNLKLGDGPWRGRILMIAMGCLSAGLLALALATELWVANLVFLVVGACVVIQFNGTNVLFQLLSPLRLRGRVISMHVWAINGISPFGVLALGALARQARGWNWPLVGGGVNVTFTVASLGMLVGTALAISQRHHLTDLDSPSNVPGAEHA